MGIKIRNSKSSYALIHQVSGKATSQWSVAGWELTKKSEVVNQQFSGFGYSWTGAPVWTLVLEEQSFRWDLKQILNFSGNLIPILGEELSWKVDS